MKVIRNTVKFIVFAGIFAAIFSCNTEIQKISGKVAMVGHEPFVSLSVKSDNRVEYKIIGPLTGKLTNEYQGRIVTLEGTVIKKAAGPGFPAEFLAETIIE